MGRIVTQLHATTVTKLFAKTTIRFLLCRDFDKEMTSAMELCILWNMKWLVPINCGYQYCSYLKLS